MTTTRTTMTPKLEDAEFMAASGESLTGALQRLGYRDRTGLYNLCLRHKRTDIYTRLLKQDLL